VPGYFSCPSADCDHVHVNDDEGVDNNIWLCQNPTCRGRICTVHDVPFHTNETCAQYDERKAIEDRRRANIDTLATKAKLLRYSKTCPNLECGVHIHKSSGCDHMTCKLFSSDVWALLMSLKARCAGTNSAGGVWLLIKGLKASGGSATVPTRDTVGTTALLETIKEPVRRVGLEACNCDAER
jgi:hypothetical protein